MFYTGYPLDSIANNFRTVEYGLAEYPIGCRWFYRWIRFWFWVWLVCSALVGALLWVPFNHLNLVLFMPDFIWS
jgi:hypothetical protein